MHSFFIFGVLLHATALTVIGFFVQFAADRATGRVQSIGKLLGWWLYLLAAVALIGGLFAIGSGRVPGRGWMGEPQWMGGHHGQWMGGYPQRGMMYGPPVTTTPPETTPVNSQAPAAQ